MAAKKFKRGMSAKPIYDLNKKILDLIYDLTTSKQIPFRVNSSKAKKYLLNEILILKSMFLLAFIYFKCKLIIDFSKKKL